MARPDINNYAASRASALGNSGTHWYLYKVGELRTTFAGPVNNEV